MPPSFSCGRSRWAGQRRSFKASIWAISDGAGWPFSWWNDCRSAPRRVSRGCTGWTETQAAHRFLGAEVYDRLDILELHRHWTQARMAPHAVVLCLQDITELHFSGQALAGLGP